MRPPSWAAEKVVVAVTAIEKHPALDACRDGVRDALKAAGYVEGKNLEFVYEEAKGDPAIAIKIAQKFAKDRPNVIVAISTPSAQAIAKTTVEIPVVFTAVTDPLGAQLVRDMNRPGGYTTGISDLAPIKKQFDLIKEITPGARAIGVLFNPKESNSRTLVRLMKMAATNGFMTVVEAPVAKSSDVAAAAASLIGKADVIFIPTDNTVIAMLGDVIKVGIDNQMPVYTGDIELGEARRDCRRRLRLLQRRLPDGKSRRANPQGREAGNDPGGRRRRHVSSCQSRDGRENGREDSPGRCRPGRRGYRVSASGITACFGSCRLDAVSRQTRRTAMSMTRRDFTKGGSWLTNRYGKHWPR